jgi:hypothetical protein
MLNDMIIVGLCFKFIEYLIAAYKLNIHIEGLIV